MKATEILSKEHESILDMLKIMTRISGTKIKNGSINVEQFEEIIDFLKSYADKNHHGKEEDMLFPEMIKAGVPSEHGPIGVMLHDHNLGRNYIKGMTDALQNHKNGDGNALKMLDENLLKYVDMLTNHIYKEDHILFPMAARVVTSNNQASLFDKFTDFEVNVFGKDNLNKYLQFLNQLKSEYL